MHSTSYKKYLRVHKKLQKGTKVMGLARRGSTEKGKTAKLTDYGLPIMSTGSARSLDDRLRAAAQWCGKTLTYLQLQTVRNAETAHVHAVAPLEEA